MTAVPGPPPDLPVLDAAGLARVLSPADAVRAVEQALRDGLDPSAGTPRTTVPLARGHLLLMPAEVPTAVGVKVISVVPENPERGLPRIQGLYLLFDGASATPVAVIDGAALTTLRTPAVSVAAVRARLSRGTDPMDVVVYGTGPQGLAHARTLADALSATRAVARVTFASRSGGEVVLPDLSGAEVSTLPAGSRELATRTEGADVVVCATTARRPVFDAARLRDDAVVVAVGSHEPDAWELDPALLLRSAVVVEDVGTAMREAGDVVQAVASGLDPAALLTLRDVVTGVAAPGSDRPVVFRSVGMAWEDLVVAAAAVEAARVLRA